MKIQVLEKGGVQFRSRLLRLKGESQKLLRDAIKDSARKILEASRPLVPVDTGFLKASGFYGATAGSDSAPTIVVGYSAPYAVHVHERVEIPHRIGQAKFLEVAYYELRGEVPGWVRDYMAKRLRRARK